MEKIKGRRRQKVVITSQGLGAYFLENQFGDKLGYGGLRLKDAIKRANTLQEKLDKEFEKSKNE